GLSVQAQSIETIYKASVKKVDGSREYGILLQLNENELTILRMLADGHNNAEIADHLFLAKRTIEGIRTRLLEKAKVKTTASLIAFAYRNGFLK
ncbi:MAG: helix-turn-helix transcriptional regulator, partial [Bacteroidota bacterium]